MVEKIKSIFKFIKTQKRSAIIIVVSLTVIIFIIVSEVFDASTKNEKEVSGSTYFEEYTQLLERKLENIVSSIQGAGECKIMVTIDTGEESIYAKQAKNQNEDREESSKSSDEYEYVILKSSSSKEEGMLLKVIEPNVRGVAVVCQGGDDPQIKENIINTVSAVLDIKSNKISISKMK